MPKQLLIFIGGVDNEDYDTILEMAKDGSTGEWSSTKFAVPGDKVLLYVAKPKSALIAKAEVLTSAKPGKRWQFESEVGRVEILNNQLNIKQLKAIFPKWKWLFYPRGKCVVPAKYSKRLWKLVNQKPKANLAIQPKAKNGSGGGFGDYEMNKIVEIAAIKGVTKHYKAKGCHVESVERDKIGFDLRVTKGKLELHVEVKGIQGTKPEFILTANEKQEAARDPLYRLAMVTKATSTKLKIKIINGKRLLQTFKLTPISYKVSPFSS